MLVGRQSAVQLATKVCDRPVDKSAPRMRKSMSARRVVVSCGVRSMHVNKALSTSSAETQHEDWG